MRTLLRLIALVAVAALGVTAVVVAGVPEVARIVTANESTSTPLPELSPLAQRSIVYDTAGSIVDIFKVENREPFTIDQVPKEVIDAFLAVEDEGFYLHKGVNAKSLVRAMLANVSAGEVTQGGSTITQQLVKNALLTNRQEADRKLLEAYYAIRLEKEWTKDQILERYLNSVFFGNNSYGMQAAAETYFGKNVRDLTMVEGAFLAGLVRNPVGYDPIRRPERSRARFRIVTERLAEVGLVARQEAEALAADWPLPERLQRPPDQLAARSYFTEEVRNQLLNKSTILGADYQQRYNALFRGGLKIFTTLDPRLQVAAEQAKATQLPDTGGRFEAALLSLETRTGAVRAMVGGPGFDQSQVNLTLTRRQSGSSIKIFILASALAAGVQPNDLVDGANCSVPDPTDKETGVFAPGGEEEPVGPVERMTWLSINCAYLRMSLAVGLERVVAMSQALGVQSPLSPFLSFTTGANEVSTLDMATGMATLANGGVRNEPYYVERIEGPDGQVIYQHDAPGTQVIDKAVADTAIDVLKGTVLRGTGRRARLEGDRPAAGKTGTQDENTNAWFVAATPQYTAAVWMGDPKAYTPMRNIPEFTQFNRVQGGTYPALIWKAYMDTAHVGLPVEDWNEPPAPERRPARIFAPGVECVVGGIRGLPGAGVPTTASRSRRSTDSTTATTPADAGSTDLAAPIVTAPANAVVYECAKGPPRPTAPPTTRPPRPTDGPTTTTDASTDTTAPSEGGGQPPAPSTPPSSVPPTTQPSG